MLIHNVFQIMCFKERYEHFKMPDTCQVQNLRLDGGGGGGHGTEQRCIPKTLTRRLTNSRNSVLRIYGWRGVGS